MRRLITLTVLITCLPFAAHAQSTRPSDLTARQALTHKVPELKLTGLTLSDAIDSLRDITGLNINVHWRALEQYNITRETPVTLRLRNVSAGNVLRALVNEVGQGQLTYYVEDDMVEITTREIADQEMFTEVYSVEDLVMIVPDFVGPTLNLQQSAQVSGGGGGGGGGQSLLSSANQATNEQTSTKRDRGEALVKLITDTVKPDIWRENGGVASIRYFNGHLIVTAPRSVHESIGGSFK